MSTRRMAQRMIAHLNEKRQKEEEGFSAEKFSSGIAKGYRTALLVICFLGLALGAFLIFYIKDIEVGAIFGCLGVLTLFTLPTYLSYHCDVDNYALKTEYYILCFKSKKEVLWQDVKYKKVKRDNNDQIVYIRLYDANRKKLISFDSSVVGVGHIVRMARRIQTLRRS